jgi:hypothetical protein
VLHHESLAAAATEKSLAAAKVEHEVQLMEMQLQMQQQEQQMEELQGELNQVRARAAFCSSAYFSSMLVDLSTPHASSLQALCTSLH